MSDLAPDGERPAETPAAVAPPDAGIESAPSAPSQALDQDDPVTPEDLEPTDELVAKGLDAWTPVPPIPPELEKRVRDLAPQPPMGLKDEDAQRWAMCSTIATLVAIDQFDGDPDVELRKFAWSTARSMFNDPTSFPVGEPPASSNEGAKEEVVPESEA